MGRPRIHPRECVICGASTRATVCRRCYLAQMLSKRAHCVDCDSVLPRSSKATRCRRCFVAQIADGHSQAQRLYSLDGVRCEMADCDSAAMDRHHIDGNPLNNARENVMFLCRRHHMLADGRLDTLRTVRGARGRGRGPVARDERGRFAVEDAA
jgi:ribosomal protein L40E